MIIAGLLIGGAVLAAFVILVTGIRSTERHLGLRNHGSDGLAAAFARRVLGVYVRQTEDQSQDRENCYGQVRR